MSDAHLVETTCCAWALTSCPCPSMAHAVRRGRTTIWCASTSPGELRDEFEFYPCRLRRSLPRIRIPLGGDDPDVLLDLLGVLVQTYDAASFRDRIDYLKPCLPPLSPDDQTWADQLIQQALIAAK